MKGMYWNFLMRSKSASGRGVLSCKAVAGAHIVRPGNGFALNKSAVCSCHGRQYSAMQKYCKILPASTNRCQTKCIYRFWDL